MNNLNQEDFSRYVPESECDYLIDQKLPKQVERNYLEDSHFRMVISLPFLDSTHTAFPYRSFYVSIDDYEKHLRYNPYYLLRRVKEEEFVKEQEIQVDQDQLVLQSSETYLDETELSFVC